MTDTTISGPERLRRLCEEAGKRFRQEYPDHEFDLAIPVLHLANGEEVRAVRIGLADRNPDTAFRVAKWSQVFPIRFSDVVGVRMIPYGEREVAP